MLLALHRRLGVALWLGSAACGAEPTASEATGAEIESAAIVLHIDAAPAVAMRAAALRVRLLALPTLPAATDVIVLEEPTRSVLYDVFTWPQALRVPDELLHEGQALWVEVAALDVTGRELTLTRLLTQQLAQRVLEPELMLSERCLDVICGARTQTCASTGFCGSAIRAAEGLPSTPLD